MPHLIIDYSANLEEIVDMEGFCEALRDRAAGLEALPMAGVRVRAFKADHVSIADGDSAHGYVDISVRMREGRSQRVKEQVAAALFEAAEGYLADVIARRSVMVSLEVREINACLAPKVSTVRNWIERNSEDG